MHEVIDLYKRSRFGIKLINILLSNHGTFLIFLLFSQPLDLSALIYGNFYAVMSFSPIKLTYSQHLYDSFGLVSTGLFILVLIISSDLFMHAKTRSPSLGNIPKTYYNQKLSRVIYILRSNCRPLMGQFRMNKRYYIQFIWLCMTIASSLFKWRLPIDDDFLS